MDPGLKAFLDTHTAFYLWAGNLQRFSGYAQDLVERSALFVCPIVRLELNLLQQIGRIEPAPARVLQELEESTGLVESDDSMQAVIAEALDIDWTRDPFDLMIVATAQLHRAPLVTRDRTILQHCEHAVS
jgi:PIN domain nuclease of toxin-antitoxin system